MKLIFQIIIILNLTLFNTLDTSKFINGIIEIKNKSIKIGNIKQGEIATVNFELKNTSKKTIQLFSVTSTCGCTIVNYPKQILSNEKIIINVKFNSTGFIGPVKKELVLITNDSLKYYKMELSARVIK
jgi:hypothetical protein